MIKFYLGLSVCLFAGVVHATTLTEDFESSAFTKSTYDVTPAGNGSEDNVSLASGTWRMYTAVRGNLAGSDRYNGTQSVRARADVAVIEMQFNKPAGAGTISVYAAKYGSDANSTFRFEASTDGGATWPYNSSTFTVSSTTLSLFSWVANLSGGVRVRIVKLSSTSTSNRTNFDDFSITDYSTGTSEINLQQPAGTDQTCGFSYNFGTLTIGNNADLSVRVQNLGTGDMGIGTVSLSGSAASEFSVVTLPAATTAPAAYSDMVIRFTALQPGAKSVTLTLTSDDPDESPCTIELIANAVYTPCTELLISEYGEPVTGSGKYVEIYNPTNAAIDLSNYRLWMVANGGTWPEFSYSLSGMLAAKDAYVVAYDNTVTGYDVINTTVCNFNGNDAVALAKNIAGTYYVIDAIGDVTDPGTGWQVAGLSNATKDHTLVRKSSVTTPNADWTSSAGSSAANSEWYVRPYGLGNVACHINACSVLSTVSFSTTNTTVSESGASVTVNVSMDVAPAADVTVNIYDALLGTASAGSDYTFATSPLTFPATGSYPLTQSVTVTILNDAVSESNENIVLSIDAQCGALTGNGSHMITILDDEIPEGLIINEMSQGSASKEYVELVVAGTPGTTVDLRGWIIDDNSGIFSGGYGTLLGFAPGHLKFSNICTWEKVPAGSIILLYNASDKNIAITLADDPTDANLDYTYVIGIEVSATSCATMAISNLYFSSDCVIPNNSSYDTYTPPSYTNADWNAMQFRNAGDAIQLRSPSGGFYHGISYGSKGGGSDCSTCAITQANHPDYPIYGSEALYFSGTSNITYALLNTTDDDFRKLSNWSKSTTTSPNALETPGTFNSANNQAWILSLRAPFDIVTDNQSYTCNLRAYESRYYLDGSDRIIFYIKNNGATDHGSFTAQTILHDDATAGLGFQNTSLSGTPLFMQKTFAGTPSIYTPADYKIRFYVNNQELQDFCDYINPIIDATLSTTGTNFTPATIIAFLKIYRTSGVDRAWTVTSDVQTEIVMPVTGAYGPYSTFEHDPFNEFSGYALGVTITELVSTVLPVELVSFTAECQDGVMAINWKTASEDQASHFELERSYDALHFTRIASVPASGNSSAVRQYLFVDDNFLEQKPVYYRLKQVDMNGASEYSAIITQTCGQEAPLVSVYPNPAHNLLYIALSGDARQYDKFMLYDVTGRLMKRVVVRNPELVELDISDLANGVYILQAEHPGGWSYRQKIVKD